MYGLINKAVRSLVVDNFGLDTWNRIRKKAGVEEEVFVAMERYPDETTYALVGAASEILEIPAETVLETFGVYWVKFADEHYGELMKSAGSTFPEFLANLDQMHARVQLSFPELVPPSFRSSVAQDQRIRLDYFSERDGLAPLAVGMLRGVAQRFSVELDVTHSRSDDGGHDVFHIAYKAAGTDGSSS